MHADFQGGQDSLPNTKAVDRGEKSSSHIKLGTSFYGAEAGHCYVNK